MGKEKENYESNLPQLASLSKRGYVRVVTEDGESRLIKRDLLLQPTRVLYARGATTLDLKGLRPDSVKLDVSLTRILINNGFGSSAEMVSNHEFLFNGLLRVTLYLTISDASNLKKIIMIHNDLLKNEFAIQPTETADDKEVVIMGMCLFTNVSRASFFTILRDNGVDYKLTFNKVIIESV